MMKLRLVLHLAACLWASVAQRVAASMSAVATVYMSKRGEAKIVTGVRDFENGAAVGIYGATVNVTGWDTLRVHALPNAEPGLAAFAAGYVEGWLTHESILSMYANNYDDWFRDGNHATDEAAKIFAWLEENFEYVRMQSAQNKSDPYWRQVSLIVSQLDGMLAGVNAAAGHEALQMRDILLLNADGDVESLQSALFPNSNRKKELRCSSLIKLIDGPDILFGHTTWDHFDMDLRTLKRYNFAYRGMLPVNISMSSSPAFLSSVDDFYLTSHGLGVIETTNGVYNDALWSKLTPKSVLSWFRANVANALAQSTKEWGALFSKENSGTYVSSDILNRFCFFFNIPFRIISG